MLHPDRRVMCRDARRWLLSLLALALLLYGQSSTRLQLLGPWHHHAPALAAGQVSPSPSWQVSQAWLAWLDTFQAWRAHNHARVHAVGLMAHPHVHRTHDNAHDSAHHVPHHSHDGLQRHQHDRADATVVALDIGGAGSDPLAQASSHATQGAAAQPWGAAARPWSHTVCTAAPDWPVTAVPRWADAPLAPLERPPCL